MAIVEWGALQTVAPSGATSQSILKLPNGNFVIAWQTGSGTTAEVYFQIFSAAGEPLTSATLVPETSELADNFAPSLVLTGEGFLVLASSAFQGDTGDDDVVGVRYDPSGAYLGRGEYPGTSADDANPNAVFANGNLFTVYDDGDGVKLSREPLAGGSAETLDLDTTGSFNHPDIALGAFGSMIAVWQDGGSIVGQQIASDGTLVNAVFTVVAGDSFSSPFAPNITALTNGNYLVTYGYSSLFGSGTSFAILSAAGSVVTSGPVGGSGFLESLSVEAVPLSGGGFYLVSTLTSSFTDSTTIQRYDAAGAKVGLAQDVLMGEGETVRGVQLLDDGRLVVLIVDADGATKFQMLDGREGIVEGYSAADTLYGNDLYNDQIKGRGGIDYLNGLGGNDRLDGGTGADVMEGGLGDDVFIVDNAGDQVIEYAGEGIDTIQVSFSYNLNGSQVENATLTGTSAGFLVGNALSNTLIGNAAANQLNGASGADRMYGGFGDDVYTVDNVGDLVVERAGQGTADKVNSSLANYTLGAEVENLTLIGTNAINGTGNALGNFIVGNTATNTLVGAGGADRLQGGGGADKFVYTAVSDSAPSGYDRILDLSADDRIDLRAIDANTMVGGDQAFTKVAAFTGVAGQLTLTFSGGVTDLRADVNGDGVFDFRILITGNHTAHTGFDF